MPGWPRYSGKPNCEGFNIKNFIPAPYLNVIHLQKATISHIEAAENPATHHDSLFYVDWK